EVPPDWEEVGAAGALPGRMVAGALSAVCLAWACRAGTGRSSPSPVGRPERGGVRLSQRFRPCGRAGPVVCPRGSPLCVRRLGPFWGLPATGEEPAEPESVLSRGLCGGPVGIEGGAVLEHPVAEVPR